MFWLECEYTWEIDVQTLGYNFRLLTHQISSTDIYLLTCTDRYSQRKTVCGKMTLCFFFFFSETFCSRMQLTQCSSKDLGGQIFLLYYVCVRESIALCVCEAPRGERKNLMRRTLLNFQVSERVLPVEHT